MPLMGWVLLIGIGAAVALWEYALSKGTRGPSRCIGCGKCDRDGICILTGKPVGPRRTKPGGEHPGSGSNAVD